ncbi:PAS domain S-box protein [Lunatimonas salinarum]|uniref:PAS domain S-box protein n=1 Tax=Lunatimonas salinarum TaxID=1774590 RepID=UPI001ADF2BA7|nr:PAS domain S-box protein [Lunatimonas salinarum]
MKDNRPDFSSFFYFNPLPSWVYELDSYRILDVNEAAIAHYGYTRDEFLSLTIKHLLLEAEIPQLVAAHEDVWEREGNFYFGVFTHQKKGGEIIRMKVNGHKVDYLRRACMMVVCQDVTQEEKLLAQLAQSERRLKDLSALAKLGYWKYDAGKQLLSWTDEAYRIWGREKGVFNLDLGELLQTIYPEDRELVRETHRLALKEREGFHLEYRILLPNGAVRWVDQIAIWANGNADGLVIEGTVQDISTRKQNELQLGEITAKLEESERRFRIAQEISPDGFTILHPIKDEDGTVVDFEWVFQNKAIAEINGTNPNSVVGKRLLKLFPMHKHSPLFASYVSVATTGKTEVFEESNLREFVGVPTWLRLVIVSMGEDIAVLTQNITKQKEAEERLRESEVKYKTIFDIASVGIAQADPNSGEITLINAYYETITGYSLSELNGMKFKELTHPDDRQRDWEIYRKAAAGECEYKNEKRYVKKDGSIVWVRLHIAFVRDETGKPIISVAICEDISERKQFELKLQELNRSLEKRTHDLEVMNADLEQFAFIVSHDLQEPLRMISSFMEQLKKKYGDQLDEKAHQYIGFATDGAKRMREIILDLLEYSRAGRLVDQVEKVALNELFADYQLLRKKLIAENRVTLHIPELPVIACYRAPMTQTIHSLLDNAIKYARPGVSPVIHVSAEDSGSFWQISVADNGIGIDREHFDNIFVVFKRLHRTDKHQGTGIGLSIAKKQVESWGGKIWLTSTPGEGSVFYFTIPKAKFDRSI